MKTISKIKITRYKNPPNSDIASFYFNEADLDAADVTHVYTLKRAFKEYNSSKSSSFPSTYDFTSEGIIWFGGRYNIYSNLLIPIELVRKTLICLSFADNKDRVLEYILTKEEV